MAIDNPNPVTCFTTLLPSPRNHQGLKKKALGHVLKKKKKKQPALKPLYLGFVLKGLRTVSHCTFVLVSATYDPQVTAWTSSIWLWRTTDVWAGHDVDGEQALPWEQAWSNV